MFKNLLKKLPSNQPPRPQVVTADDIDPMSSCSMPSDSLSYSSYGRDLGLDQPIVLDSAQLHKAEDEVPDTMFGKEALGGVIPKKAKKKPSDPKLGKKKTE